MFKFLPDWMIALAVAATACVMAAGPASAASPEEDLEEDHELSMEFQTPHTDWAQPYALGKVRLMYFGWGSYNRGIEARDLIELLQRFDIEARAAYYHRIVDSSDERWRGFDKGRPIGVERIMRLLDQPWHCFLFHGIPVTHLPAQAQEKVLKAIAAGAGLVLIGVDDERALRPENRLTELPPFLSNDPVGDPYRLGKGRAMRLPMRPQIPYRPGWETDYDYWMERVGRAVLWTADTSPRVSLTISREAGSIERAELPSKRVSIGLAGATPQGGLDLQVRLRRSDGLAFMLHPEASPRGSMMFCTFGKRLPAGHYHVDAIARSKDGVEAWATTPVEITAPRKVESITLSKDWGEVGEKRSVSIMLTGQPAQPEKVRVQLLDARQRILVQADRPVKDTRADFEFKVEPWMPMLLEVRALVMDGEGEVSSASRYFRVTKRKRGQFNFVVWDWPRDTLAPYVEQQLARLGCTVQLAGGEPPLTLAAADVAQVPYTTRIMTSWDEKGYMKPTCWNDEPAVDKWVDSIASKYEKSRQHGVFVYSLGDETATTGCCVHPACLAAYRRYLKQEYGSIAALNKSWGADYASFDQVDLLVAGGNDEAEALRRKVYPRWYDRQAFKAYNFANLCERFGGRFRKLDPKALTGFEGAGKFADGTDIDLICRTNGFWTTYGGPVDEVIRSIAPRQFIRANWMGYDRDAESLLAAYWRMVTRGMDSVWWWRWDGMGTYRGLLAPHMAPYRVVAEMQRDTSIVRDGLGALLAKCTREDDRIAILYSYPSTFANRIETGPSYGRYEDNHVAWHCALRSLGLQFSYVTDRMLRLGEFRAERYKVLILPQAEAIGPTEARAIREFARTGGTIIADLRPGIYDGHCKPLKPGCLDDVLGIERTGANGVVTGNVAITGALGRRRISSSLGGVTLDPMVRLTVGQALGQADAAPVCIVNRVGKGRAVLLNFTMASFWPKGNEPPPAAADFVAALLAVAGVEPEIIVTDASGKPVRDCEVIRWRGPGLDLLTLFDGKDEQVQVHLPQPRHVYDIREGAYRGRQSRFTAHKMPNRATFIALSDRPLPAPQISPSASSIPRGQGLTVALSHPQGPAVQAVHLRVYQPDGSRAEWFDQVALVGKRGKQVALPIAYNDPTGAWTIRAVDLCTQKAATAHFEVK